MITAAIVLSVLALAFANDASDNFKGVATLCGSGTLSHRRALAWATVTTLAGSLSAILLSDSLLKRFSGKAKLSAGPYKGACALLAPGVDIPEVSAAAGGPGCC